MNVVLVGALAGLGLAVVLLIFEVISAKRSAAERAKRLHQREAKLDSTEQKAIRTLFRFCLILPAAFALGAWLIWG